LNKKRGLFTLKVGLVNDDNCCNSCNHYDFINRTSTEKVKQNKPGDSGTVKGIESKE
jgi:hypothetical protein